MVIFTLINGATPDFSRVFSCALLSLNIKKTSDAKMLTKMDRTILFLEFQPLNDAPALDLGSVEPLKEDVPIPKEKFACYNSK